MIYPEYTLSRAEIQKVERSMRRIERQLGADQAKVIYERGLLAAARVFRPILASNTPTRSGFLQRSIRIQKSKSGRLVRVGYAASATNQTLIPRALTSGYGPGSSRTARKTPANQFQLTVKAGRSGASRAFIQGFRRSAEVFLRREAARNRVSRLG